MYGSVKYLLQQLLGFLYLYGDLATLGLFYVLRISI